MSSCLYTVAFCHPPCYVSVVDDVKKCFLRHETGASSAEGKHERLSILRISVKEPTEVSRSLENGSMSSGGSTSGIAELLSPRGMCHIKSKQILTAMNKSHCGLKPCKIELALVVSISEWPDHK